MISPTEITTVVEQMQFADRFGATIMSPNVPTVSFDYHDQIRIKTANIPNYTIETASVNYGGKSIQIAKNKTYDSIVVTFYDSEYAGLRHKFDNWMHAIYNRSTNRLGFYDDYISSRLYLYLYQTTDEKASGVVEFKNLYPTQVDDITFDRTSADTWVEFKVSFAFETMTFTSGKDLIDSSKSLDAQRQEELSIALAQNGLTATTTWIDEPSW